MEQITLKQPPLHLRIFIVAYVSALMGLLTCLFVAPGTTGEGIGNIPFLVSWVSLYAITGFYLILYPPAFSRADWPLILLMSLTLMSAFWSTNTTRSWLYSSSFCMNVLFSVLMRRFYTVEEFLAVTMKIILGMVFASMILHISGFSLVQYNDVHDRVTLVGTEPLRGLFNHKITAGLYAVIAATIAYKTYKGFKRAIIVTTFAIFILLTGSSSAISLFFIAFAMQHVVSAARAMRLSWGVFAILFLAATVIVSLLLVLCLGPLMQVLGRDPTLTGRTVLWQWGISVGNERPFFGWGYFGYLGTELAAAYARSLVGFGDYDVPHFHNSYIQTYVELGWTGLAISVLILLSATRRAYPVGTTGRGGEPLLGLLMLLFIAGTVIHTFFKYNDFSSFFIVTSFLLTSRAGVKAASDDVLLATASLSGRS